MQPTLLAYVALALWPLVSLAAFSAVRPRAAVCVTILGGVLLLPVGIGFDLEGLPRLDRHSIACLSALAGCVLFAPRTLSQHLPGTGPELPALVLLASGFVTTSINTDPVQFGPLFLPPLGLRDGVSMAADLMLGIWIPFFLGRVLFREPEDLATLLSFVCVGGLIYSVPILYELRMSPQLHRIAYGFHQHAFLQTIRGEGWRPMVFMPHGLSLSLFMLSASLCAIGLWRARVQPFGLPSAVLAAYLPILLVAMRSVATTIYGLAVIPLAVLGTSRTQLLAAAAGVCLVFTYPLVRSLDLLPVGPVLEAAAAVSERRHQSLKLRFDNEDRLIGRALQRPWFGWGGWGRSRVHDPVTGEDRSITDGYWIIVLGNRGVVGLVATLALLLGPPILAYRRRREFPPGRPRLLLASTALMVLVMGVDLLPNAFLNPYLVLVAGALAGTCELRTATRELRGARLALGSGQEKESGLAGVAGHGARPVRHAKLIAGLATWNRL